MDWWDVLRGVLDVQVRVERTHAMASNHQRWSNGKFQGHVRKPQRRSPRYASLSNVKPYSHRAWTLTPLHESTWMSMLMAGVNGPLEIKSWRNNWEVKESDRDLKLNLLATFKCSFWCATLSWNVIILKYVKIQMICSTETIRKLRQPWSWETAGSTSTTTWVSFSIGEVGFTAFVNIEDRIDILNNPHE